MHIINIKSTPNNTILNFTDANGKTILSHTAGIEGFKNAKKGTNIAGQQAAITLGNVSIHMFCKSLIYRCIMLNIHVL